MRPPLWPAPGERSTAEHARIKRIRRAKGFVFLRPHRHTLCADPWPQALATLSQDQPQGPPPVPPAHLALAPLLQASTQVAEDAVMEATTMERRGPWGLEGLDCAPPPCSTGPLGAWRQRLMAQPRDRRLLARTVESAAGRGALGARQGRAALARRPLWGAGGGDETSHLLGHALRKAVGVIARPQGRGLPEGAAEAGAALGAGASRPAALALAGAAATAPPQARTRRLDARHAVAPWLETQPVEDEAPSRAVARLAVAQPGGAPDLTTTPAGPPTRRHGVAADRRLSLAEAERRHGRTRRRLRVAGEKRHGLRALERPLLVAVGSTPANVPAAHGPDASAPDRAAPTCPLQAWPMARASLARTLVQQRSDARALCWPSVARTVRSLCPHNSLAPRLGTARAAWSGGRDEAL